MSVLAWVNCRCYVEGRTTPLPVPKSSFCFQVDERPGPCPEQDDRIERLIDEWLRMSCPHRGQHLVFLGLARRGLGLFHEALALVDPGEARYRALNHDDGDLTPPKIAARCLKELADFRATAEFGPVSCLVDEEAGDLVDLCLPNGVDRTLGWLPGRIEVGLDRDGVFVRRRATIADRLRRQRVLPTRPPTVELWRSRRFEQRLLQPLQGGTYPWNGPVEFVDGASRATIQVSLPIARALDASDPEDDGPEQRAFPARLRVEERTGDASLLGPLLDDLEQLWRASVETGHPVVWSY
jgi:hypothetical protein